MKSGNGFGIRFSVESGKEAVEDRQVQHIFESNVTSAALAPNVACHKCLAQGLNLRHLCSNQSILPLDYRDGQEDTPAGQDDHVAGPPEQRLGLTKPLGS